MKILINKELNYYRANLHCHSTISDGTKTCEELKKDYMNHGYSVIAFTDHNVFVPHNDLTDDKFVALNGYELDVSEKKNIEKEDNKTCHLCYIALDDNNDLSVCYNNNKYIWGNAKAYADKQNYGQYSPDYVREYSHNGINEMIDLGRKNGYFVTYNHPTWSLEEYPQYSGYKGMNAMEISNFGCIVCGWEDDNTHAYSDLLNLGNKLYCIATDDNHNRHPDDSPDCDSYGGYVMINASKLEYKEITKALESGNFYSSTGNYKISGPEIYSLIYEDDEVTIETSNVRSIAYYENKRCAHIVNANQGETVNKAVFKVGDCKWFRLVITDNNGFKAYTNAYFIDDLI